MFKGFVLSSSLDSSEIFAYWFFDDRKVVTDEESEFLNEDTEEFSYEVIDLSEVFTDDDSEYVSDEFND